AMRFLIAGEEVDEHAGMHELPALALAKREDLAEQLLGLAARKEVLLVGRALVGIAGRDRNADAEPFAEVEELRDVLGRMSVEDRRIHVDGEATRLSGLDGGDGAFEAAVHANRLVVMFLDAVEMDGKKQVGRRLELAELLFKQKCIGAQRHK